MKIYTKTGDKGQTSLLSGTRVFKHDSRLEAYGTIDELNSFLGLIVNYKSSNNNSKNLKLFLTWIEKSQHYLFNIGSYLACDKKEFETHLPSLDTQLIENLEKAIDQMNEELPELKDFIIPGGSQFASQIHCARSICRRAERRCTETESNSHLTEKIIPFLNRLSDYLFCLARYANWSENLSDMTWDKSQT